jgi:hypothetical protein
MEARLATNVGTRAYLRLYWGDDCPNCDSHGSPGYHNAMVRLGDTEKLDDWSFMGEPRDHLGDPRWPTKCDHCGKVAPADATRQVFRDHIYDTPSGKLEPGCLYWADWYRSHDAGGGCVFHDNCDGRHLMATLPNGCQWDIDGRANNCTMKEDRSHRCWVRHGEPPNVTVDKNGATCSAGAGSIQAGDYHGFLTAGIFT